MQTKPLIITAAHSYTKEYISIPTQDLRRALRQHLKDQSAHHHALRQHIFQQPLMQHTNHLSCETKAVHQHTDHPFTDKYQAAILLTCTTYHPLHLDYIAEQISSTGSLECRQCKTKCEQMKEIAVDPLLWAYHSQINQYLGCYLVISRRQVGELARDRMLEQAESSHDKTLIVWTEQGQSRIELVEVKLLQVARDESINLQVQTLSALLDRAKGQSAETYRRKYLSNSTVPILANTVCFQSLVRIRNPLINRHCLPALHDHRLIVFSYEHVYHSLFEAKTQRVGCRYPGCPNYFDALNFCESGIVVAEMQGGYYEQSRENLVGVYFNNRYVRNWQIGMVQQGGCVSGVSQQDQLGLEWSVVRGCWEQLVSGGNVREGAVRANKLMKKLQTAHQQPLHHIQLPPSIHCPVRCIKCPTLTVQDITTLAAAYHRHKKCGLCGWQTHKKQFYDLFYIDVQLLEFFYLHGHAPSIYFDTAGKRYLHRLQYYTGRSLRRKLESENRVARWKQEMGDLECGQKQVAVIDEICYEQPDAVAHVCFLQVDQVLSDLECGKCGRGLRVDRLLLCDSKPIMGKRQNMQREGQLQLEQKLLLRVDIKQEQGIDNNRHAGINIRSIRRKFPAQIKALTSNHHQYQHQQSKQGVRFDGVQTQGNLLMFNYAVSLSNRQGGVLCSRV